MNLRQQTDCSNLGWPPALEPSPPFIPNPPSPSDLERCINGWAFFWVRYSQNQSTKFWIFIKRIRYDINAVEGCVLVQDQSGHYYYQYVGLYLKYITSYICFL